jgi:nicotinamidase-related amidase
MPTHPNVLAAGETALIVVDVQERFRTAIPEFEAMAGACARLVRSFRILGLPVVATEQYPKGLGHTLPEMKAALPAGLEPIEKAEFSCWAVESFRSRLTASGKRQILLGGIEAHVCVLMSALDLLAAGYAVHVVADAVTSRTQANWRLAMDYLRQAGAVVTTTETALFQLLGQADSDAFRELARLIR